MQKLFQEHSHTPWLVILFKWLQIWKDKVGIPGRSELYFLHMLKKCSMFEAQYDLYFFKSADIL